MNNNNTAVDKEKADNPFTTKSEYKIGHTFYTVTTVFNPASNESLSEIMKRLISLLILAMLAMSVMTSTALAGGDESNRAFGFTAYTDGSTLNHNPNRFQWKDGNENFIEVRHEVTGNGSGAGHSNYMYAYVQAEDYYGAKWQVPDMLYYKCTSSRLVKNTIVTPGGRANTKYEEQQGLDRIMIEGQFRPH